MYTEEHIKTNIFDPFFLYILGSFDIFIGSGFDDGKEKHLMVNQRKEQHKVNQRDLNNSFRICSLYLFMEICNKHNQNI